MSMPSTNLKLIRTKKHLDELLEGIKQFIQDNPVKIEATTTEDGSYKATLQFAQPQGDIGIVAADLFQNLRASLDYLAWELALLNDKPPDENTGFPVCRKWDSRDRKIFNRCTKSLSDEVKDEIQKLQPYQRGAKYATHPL